MPNLKDDVLAEAAKLEGEGQGVYHRALMAIHSELAEVRAKALTPQHLLIGLIVAFVIGFICGRA